MPLQNNGDNSLKTSDIKGEKLAVPDLSQLRVNGLTAICLLFIDSPSLLKTSNSVLVLNNPFGKSRFMTFLSFLTSSHFLCPLVSFRDV